MRNQMQRWWRATEGGRYGMVVGLAALVLLLFFAFGGVTVKDDDPKREPMVQVSRNAAAVLLEKAIVQKCDGYAGIVVPVSQGSTVADNGNTTSILFSCQRDKPTFYSVKVR